MKTKLVITKTVEVDCFQRTCGDCGQRIGTKCGIFGKVLEDTFLSVEPIRCPECLAAEKKAKK